MPGIKDKVAIIGMGCTQFGEMWNKGPADLIIEAVDEAVIDAGIEINDIEAVWAGTQITGYSGMSVTEPLKLQYIPVTRVENACASGTEAMRNAAYSVAAGVHNIVLALGFEKLKDMGQSGRPPKHNLSHTTASVSIPGVFAMLATRYFSRYGLTPEEGKQMLGKIAVKSHHNGAMNPKAHLQREITLDQYQRAPIIAWPLGLFDCCGVSDGAAAAILVRADMAKSFRPDPVFFKSFQICAGPGERRVRADLDYTSIEETHRAGIAAYEEAGISDPRREISMAEVHDCFSINEALIMEDLQFSSRGHVKDDIEAGTFELDGELPVQPDGGLKCFGHPVGASGIRMMYEMYLQLQGRAESRQIENPTLGMTHNMGGQPSECVVSVCIAGL